MYDGWNLFRVSDTAAKADGAAASCCLVSDIPPCTNYSGGIFIDQMLRAANGRIRQAFIVLNSVLRPQLSDTASSMDMVTLAKPREAHDDPSLPVSACREAEKAADRYVQTEVLPRLLAFTAARNIQSFWVLLEGQTMIRLAHYLLNATTLPVAVQVMDPPRNWFDMHNVDQETQAELFGQYESVLRQAACCACASWAMAEAYSTQFRVRCVPVIPSLPETVGAAGAWRPISPDRLNIGFAGQLYARQEWDQLRRVLTANDWRIDGREVNLHAFSRDIKTSDGHVLARGWIDAVPELIQALRELDLLYMPYRFSETHSEEARLCFPSKLTTYLAAGPPVLVHGPSYSSPVQFVRQHSAAFVCDETSDAALLASLHQVVSDPELYRRVAANGRKAFENNLTHDVLANAIRVVLTAGPNPRYAKRVTPLAGAQN